MVALSDNTKLRLFFKLAMVDGEELPWVTWQGITYWNGVSMPQIATGRILHSKSTFLLPSHH